MLTCARVEDVVEGVEQVADIPTVVHIVLSAYVPPEADLPEDLAQLGHGRQTHDAHGALEQGAVKLFVI